MKKYPFLIWAAVIFFTSVCFTAYATAEKGIGMLTGSKTGTYFRFGNEIAGVAKKAGLDILVKHSKGSLDNILRLDSRENAAFAIVQSDVLGFLARSDDPEMNRTAKKLRLIFPFYNEEVHLFARKEIMRFEDLRGKRIVLGVGGSGNFITSANLLNLMGMKAASRGQSSERGYEGYTHLKPSQAAEAVLMGEADAMFYVAGKPVKLFKNLEKLKEESEYASLIEAVHFVPLDDPKMLKEYAVSEISSADYAWLDNTVPTIAVKAALISFDFSEKNTPYYRKRCEELAQLGKIIRENIEELRRTGHPKWREVNLDEKTGMWKPDSCSGASAVHVPEKRVDRYRKELRRIIEGD